MNTQLIYVSKEKAEVQDEKTGVFFNQVSQGIKVKQGDLVSVEGIAINSIGVGSDIVEIPERTQDYEYYPNKMRLNSWIYINHNAEYTVKLPLAAATTYTTLADNNYGYLTNTGVPVVNLQNITQGNPNKNAGWRIGGKRMYIGRYSRWIEQATGDNNYNDYDKQNPSPSGENGGDPGSLLINVPGGAAGTTGGDDNARVWCPLITDLTCSVDAGYDNPNNIANKITADFHSADVVPQYTIRPNGAQAGVNDFWSYLTRFNTAENPNPSVNQLTCSSQNSASLLIRGIPSTEPTYNISTAQQNANYTSWIAAANPFLLYYGSRLLTYHCTKCLTFVNARPGIAAPATQTNEIINLFTAPDDGAGYADWTDGYVLTTNLEYNEFNLKLVAKLIKSQKYLPASPNTYTTEELKGSAKLEFESAISIGRSADTVGGAFTGNSPLQPRSVPAATIGALPQNVPMQTSYSSSMWSAHYLGAEALTHPGVRIDDGHLINFNGSQEYPEVISQKLDVNLCCVDSGTTGNNEMCIGLILKPGSLEGDVPPTPAGGSGLLSYNQPVLVNLQYRNPNNLCCMVINDKVREGGAAATAGDQPGNMNVGAPNINMVFDATRGRFALGNMSWPYYTKADANTTGGTQVVIANRDTNKFGYGGGTAGEYFLCYGQGGIGIVDLSVRNLSTGEWEVIDYEDPDDIRKKYIGSLWNRLGFEYSKFINKDGLPGAIYVERHWNSEIPLPNAQYFPYPVTNNSQFDTAINLSLSQTLTAGVNYPQFDFSTEMLVNNISITAETALTYASSLPQKLEFPYWLIQSDIIEGCDFNSENNGSEDNIMAVCNRAYLAGDFAFSFAPDYKFTATKDYVITGIKTRILNPDLSPAFISDKTAVIYKVESPIKMFTAYPKLPSGSVPVPKQIANGNDALLGEQHL